MNTANPVTMIADNDVTTMMTILDSRGVVDIGYSVASDFNAYTYVHTLCYYHFKCCCVKRMRLDESDDGDAVDNYNDVYFYNNRGSSGVFTGKKCGTAQQNHEMVAVGYGKDSATGLDFWVLGVYSQ